MNSIQQCLDRRGLGFILYIVLPGKRIRASFLAKHLNQFFLHVFGSLLIYFKHTENCFFVF